MAENQPLVRVETTTHVHVCSSRISTTEEAVKGHNTQYITVQTFI